jgi:transcriptional regulator with XRE-family HTH domain
VALIGEHYMTRAALTKASDLLGGATLDAVASWADDYRRHHRQTGPWHYVDIPLADSRIDMARECPNGDCVIAKTEQFLAVLRDPKANREAKGLSQGDISERSGLARSYVSRVERGHTVPAIGILERWSDALGVPIAQLFAGDRAKVAASGHQTGMRLSKEEKRFLALLKRRDEPDRRLWFSLGLVIAKAQRARQ